MAALGQTLIILTGGIDLSLGGIVALCNVVCVLSMNPDSAWGFVPALGAAAAVGCKRCSRHKRASGPNHCHHSNHSRI